MCRSLFADDLNESNKSQADPGSVASFAVTLLGIIRPRPAFAKRPDLSYSAVFRSCLIERPLLLLSCVRNHALSTRLWQRSVDMF